MSDTKTMTPCVVIIQSEGTLRKELRRAMDRSGFSALAVNSLGDALGRVHSKFYDLIACTDMPRGPTLSEDYELLVDTNGLLKRSGSRYELFRPRAGVQAHGVLLMPCRDARDLAAGARDALQHLTDPVRSAPRQLV